MREVPGDSLDELRTWPNERLLAARDEAQRLQRQWHQRRLLLDRVIDERGATDGRAANEWVQARDKVSAHTARSEVDVARALEQLPAINAAAQAGRLSMDQLEPLVQLADSETDEEWAKRGVHTAPTELNRMLRRQKAITPDEMEARRRARCFKWWRSRDGKGLRLSGELFDVDAAFVEAILEHEIETMRPAKGQPWELRSRRGADALVAICRQAKANRDGTTTTTSKAKKAWKPTVVIHMGSDAQPAVNGMPIDLATVERLIDDGAFVRTVHDDDPLAPKTGDAIPVKLRDYLKGRDATCRVPGCTRAFGLDAHHLIPRCRGGTTDKHNVVLVCTTHHHQLVPHGRWLLAGDPEQPDGLTLEDTIEARAGPDAA